MNGSEGVSQGEGTEVDRDKTGREAKLGGIRVLRTSSSAPAARTARRHKNPWRAEHLFRAARPLLGTRPAWGRVFRSFPASVLRKETPRRMEDGKIESEWNDVIRNLDSLTETKMETGGKSFVARGEARGETGAVLRSPGLRPPPVVRREDGGDFIERQPAADRPAGLSLADEKSGL